ncbi:MAG: DUF2080 family transposase-associated protein [Methanobacterium sp.]
MKLKKKDEEITYIDELEKTVKPQGHTGRIYLPVSWIGKRVKVLLLEED